MFGGQLYRAQGTAWFDGLILEEGEYPQVNIYGRNYSKALVLSRSMDALKYTDDTAVKVDLNGTFFAVDAAGNPGGAINTAVLRSYEGLILMRDHELVSSPDLSGDVSGDGLVTMYDAALVLKYTVGGTLTTGQQAQADINGDTTINATDAAAIAKKALDL
ncbi:MAG: dockerin type I repeat-containing protein [Candidatus Omnitrophota bacterium]